MGVPQNARVDHYLKGERGGDEMSNFGMELTQKQAQEYSNRKTE